MSCTRCIKVSTSNAFATLGRGEYLSVRNLSLSETICFAAFEIFCHLRSSWTHDSRSTVRFSCSISFSSSPSACTWAERRKPSKTSRSAGVAFRGGRCSPRSWRPKQAPAHFSGRRAKASRYRNYTYLQLAFGTILARILVSYIFIKPYYDYKVFSIYEYLTARFGVAKRTLPPRSS